MMTPLVPTRQGPTPRGPSCAFAPCNYRQAPARRLRPRPRSGAGADSTRARPTLRARPGTASVTAALVVSIGAAAAALGFRCSPPAVSQYAAFSLPPGTLVGSRISSVALGNFGGMGSTRTVGAATTTAKFVSQKRLPEEGADGRRRPFHNERRRQQEARMSAVAPRASTPTSAAGFGGSGGSTSGDNDHKNNNNNSNVNPPPDKRQPNWSGRRASIGKRLSTQSSSAPPVVRQNTISVASTRDTKIFPRNNGSGGKGGQPASEGRKSVTKRNGAAGGSVGRTVRGPERIFVSNKNITLDGDVDEDYNVGMSARRLAHFEKWSYASDDKVARTATVQHLSRSMSRSIEHDGHAGRGGYDGRTFGELNGARGDPGFFLAMDARSTARGAEGKSKFLSREEEVNLGTAVQEFRRLLEIRTDAEERLNREQTAEEVAADAGMTCEEYRDAMTEGLSARQKMVLYNLPLVVSLANKYRNLSASKCLQTLIQEGTFGLIRAAEMYDPTKGFRFTTYAIWWIESKLRLAVQHDRLIHVPTWVTNQFQQVTKCIPFLRASLGRDPTPEEIATQVVTDTDSKLAVSAERVQALQEWVKTNMNQLSLDARGSVSSPKPDLTEEWSCDQALLSADPSVELSSDWELFRDYLERCMIKDLSDLERKIVQMRVGLRGSTKNSRKHISELLRLPLNVVANEERSAMSKLGVGIQPGQTTLQEFTAFLSNKELGSRKGKNPTHT